MPVYFLLINMKIMRKSIFNIFYKKLKWKEIIVLIVKNIKNFIDYEDYENIIDLGKTLVLSLIWGKRNNEDKKVFKEEESTEILKIIGFIKNI